MGNGSLHPKEQELKKRLGPLYETETPPEGAVIVGEGKPQEEKAAEPEHSVSSRES